MIPLPGFLYSALKDAVGYFRDRRRKPSSSEIVAKRQKWKPVFEEQIRDRQRNGLRLDAIVRDMKRVDNYPDAKEGKGISSWFRVGLVGTYYRGIYLGLEWTTLTRDKDGVHWRQTDYQSGEQGDVRVALLGSVPYEFIDNVDWDGDEFYQFPHIYCFFRHNGEPYEHLGYYTEDKNPGGFPYYTEVVPYGAVRKLRPTSK